MQTRQNPRRNINIPGRYSTGVGSPVDVVVTDISEGGCRFPNDAPNLAVGMPMQIFIAGSGPHRATVRWIEQGEAGIVFTVPFSEESIADFKSGNIPDIDMAAHPSDFEAMPDMQPRRFC